MSELQRLIVQVAAGETNDRRCLSRNILLFTSMFRRVFGTFVLLLFFWILNLRNIIVGQSVIHLRYKSQRLLQFHNFPLPRFKVQFKCQMTTITYGSWKLIAGFSMNNNYHDIFDIVPLSYYHYKYIIMKQRLLSFDQSQKKLITFGHFWKHLWP